MADTGFFNGWSGRFKLLRRYASRKPEPGSDELDRLYEALSVFMRNPALVLLPSERAPMEPQEEWRGRLHSQATPPHFVLEVEKARGSGRLSQLRGMLELLGTAVGRLANDEEARVHLTRLPVGLLEHMWHLPGRSWRWGRVSHWHAAGAAVLVAPLPASGHPVGGAGRPRVGAGHARSSRGVVEGWAGRRRAPCARVDQQGHSGPGAHRHPLPKAPFVDQAKTPCLPNEGEVEIHGGCWVELAKRPPCYESQA